MLRTRIENTAKPAETIFKTAAAMSTGMGVVRNYANGTVGLPSSETAENIVLLDKERIPVGASAASVNHSDYEAQFNTYASGELCKTTIFTEGERFATDQYDSTTIIDSNIGKLVAVGTDGKWKLATVESKYKFVGFYNDGAHKLADIVVLDTADENA